MALYIPHSIFCLARLLYVRPETFGPYYICFIIKSFNTGVAQIVPVWCSEVLLVTLSSCVITKVGATDMCIWPVLLYLHWVIRSIRNYCNLSVCIAIEGNANGETNCQFCNPCTIVDTLVSLGLLHFSQMKCCGSWELGHFNSLKYACCLLGAVVFLLSDLWPINSSLVFHPVTCPTAGHVLGLQKSQLVH